MGHQKHKGKNVENPQNCSSVLQLAGTRGVVLHMAG